MLEASGLSVSEVDQKEAEPIWEASELSPEGPQCTHGSLSQQLAARVRELEGALEAGERNCNEVYEDLKRERDTFRAVLEAAKYQNLDLLLTRPIDEARALGEHVFTETFKMRLELEQLKRNQGN